MTRTYTETETIAEIETLTGARLVSFVRTRIVQPVASASGPLFREADLARLNEVSKPPLIYPYWHQGQFARARFSAADWVLHDGNEPPAW